MSTIMQRSRKLLEESDTANSEETLNLDSQEEKRVKYGELVVLGHNGSLADGNKGRRKSKLALYKRPLPNGIKRSSNTTVKHTPHLTDPISDTTLDQHSVSFTLSKNQAIIVQYMPDENTDMFQIGRSSEPTIDLVVMNTVPGGKHRCGKVLDTKTVSRFACRILADRNNPKICRIYAGGFNSSRNIFLGEKATKWQDGDDIDGLTTNGVLIMHPRGSFTSGDSEPETWREVSIGGGVYSLRQSRSAQEKGKALETASNILQDGTLIDLCGVTLLWRSLEGLAKSPTKDDLEALVDKVNADRQIQPIGLNTLLIPRKSANHSEIQPYVYLNCGHVHGLDNVAINIRTCSVCFRTGPTMRLLMGIEPAFYLDLAHPPVFYAFNPCGHIATEKTVKYWAFVPIPHGTDSFDSFCPFCATPIEGHPGYVPLIFT